MQHANDQLLSKVTVRIFNVESHSTVGSGVMYWDEHLYNKVYILTAAHCLYEDGDEFGVPSNRVGLSIFNTSSNSYFDTICDINYSLVSKDKDVDIAVLVLDKTDLEIVDAMPKFKVIKNRHSATKFVVKGFPEAAKGKELVCIYPKWGQSMTSVPKFQLKLEEDFTNQYTSTSQVDGFSGSGVFLMLNDSIYFYGIFARFRESGKTIYCQYAELLNELLSNNFLPEIKFDFVGEHGLTSEFFQNHIETAVENLGPRFSEELNLRLNVNKHFHDISKNEFFKKRLLHVFDNWLTHRSCGYNETNKNLIQDELKAFENLREEGVKLVNNIQWLPGQNIDLENFKNKLFDLEKKINVKRDKMYSMQYAEKRNIKDHSANRNELPYSHEISRLREIVQTNDSFLNDLSEVNVELSNNPCLLIQGEAGCGKSHLLGDIATQRQRLGSPTLLLLGQLFKKEGSVWENIFKQIDIECTKTDFLKVLNDIGQETGSRVLILIDALNEGAGKALWFDELAGFIKELNKYSFIGVVLTVRSTYWNAIIPKSIQNDKNITKIVHQGFKGNEYAALRLFCEHYGLQQPNFPILAPEYTNPLFLQLVCEGVKGTNQKIFPQGFQGVNVVFNFYLQSIYDKIAHKNDEYSLRKKIVQDAVDAFAVACFENIAGRFLLLEEAVKLFDSKFPRNQHLLDDLIRENLFIQSLQDEQSEEIIYFSYERFGDYIIANLLIKDFTTKDEVIAAGLKTGVLGKLLEKGH